MGIPVADNFSYLGRKPLDSRASFATVNDMKSFATTRLYDGLLAYVVANDKYYQFKSSNTDDPSTGKWREWSGSGGEGDNLIPDHLEAIKTKTVYDQDEEIDIDDLTVTCYYTNGTSAVIQNYTTNVNQLDTFTAGLKKLAIDYYHNGIKVSTIVNLNVNFNESYDRVQYAYKLSNAGAIRPTIYLLGLSDTIYQYTNLRIKLKIKLTIDQNNNESSTTFTVENSDIFNSTLATKIIPANTVGEYEIIVDESFEFTKVKKTPTEDMPIPLLYLKHNGSNYISGMFEVINYSFALTDPIIAKPISLNATKTYKYYIEDGTLEKTDIIANVAFNTGSVKTVVYGTDPKLTVSDIDPTYVGTQDITVSYTDNGRTASKTLTLHGFAKDKTEPDPFVEMTAEEWNNTWNYGTNLGNVFDCNGTGYAPVTEVADRFVDEQPTHWWQPSPDEQNIKEFADAGFECLRIPITWWPNSYLDANEIWHPGSWWLYRIAEVVNWALKYNLKVFINTHFDNGESAAFNDMHFEVGLVDKELLAKRCERARQLWTDIANKFKYHDERLAFEGFNEVNNAQRSWTVDETAASQMNELNQAFLDAVRATGANNKSRILICPFVIHRNSPLCAQYFVCPKEPEYDEHGQIKYDENNNIIHQNQKVSPYVQSAFHWYPEAWDQSLETMFTNAENWLNQISVPLMVNEYGYAMPTTPSGAKATIMCTNEQHKQRVMYFANYISRAKFHRIKAVAWDDGQKHNIVIKHNTGTGTNPIRGHSPITPQQSAELVEACQKGWNENLAYVMPDDQVNVYDSFAHLHCGMIKNDGTLVNTKEWTYMYTDPIPCKLGDNLSVTVNQISTTATVKGLFIKAYSFYTVDNGHLLHGEEKWGVKFKRYPVEVNAAYCIFQFYVASGPKLVTEEEIQAALFDNGDSMSISVSSAEGGDEKPITLSHKRVPTSLGTINTISPALVDDNGDIITPPTYTLDVNYSYIYETVPQQPDELPQEVEVDTKLTYYSDSVTNLGNVELIKPLGPYHKGTYEYGLEYTYNGVTLSEPHTGITFKYGKWIESMDVIYPKEGYSSEYNMSTMTEEEIKQAINDALQVTLNYTDGTSKVLEENEYTLDYSRAVFDDLGTYAVGIYYHDEEESETASISYTLTSSDDYKIYPTHNLVEALTWLSEWAYKCVHTNAEGSSKYVLGKRIQNYFLNNNLGIFTYDTKMYPYVGKIAYCQSNANYYWYLDPIAYPPAGNRIYYPVIFSSTLDEPTKSPTTQYPSSVQLATANKYTDSHDRVWYNLSSIIPGINTDETKMMTALSKGVLEVTALSDLDDIPYTSTYCYKYIGTVLELNPSEADVKELNSEVAIADAKGGTYQFTGTNTRICYAIPSALGNLTSIKNANGDELIETFTRTTVNYTQNGSEVPYYRYVLTNTDTFNDYTLTFA